MDVQRVRFTLSNASTATSLQSQCVSTVYPGVPRGSMPPNTNLITSQTWPHGRLTQIHQRCGCPHPDYHRRKEKQLNHPKQWINLFCGYIAKSLSSFKSMYFKAITSHCLSISFQLFYQIFIWYSYCLAKYNILYYNCTVFGLEKCV